MTISITGDANILRHGIPAAIVRTKMYRCSLFEPVPEREPRIISAIHEARALARSARLRVALATFQPRFGGLPFWRLRGAGTEWPDVLFDPESTRHAPLPLPCYQCGEGLRPRGGDDAR